MNVELVLILQKHFTFIGLSFQNLASFFFLRDLFFIKLTKISTIIKTCCTYHKNFLLNIFLSLLRHIAVKTINKHKTNTTFTNTLFNLASQMQHTFSIDFIYISLHGLREIIFTHLCPPIFACIFFMAQFQVSHYHVLLLQALSTGATPYLT